MNIETAICSHLISRPSVSGKISSRMYPLKLPQNPTYPAVVYRKISGSRHHDIDIAMPRIQYSCFASKYLDAKDLADAIRKELQRYKGYLSGIPIKQIVFEGEQDFYEQDTKVYHVAIDFKILYEEV